MIDLSTLVAPPKPTHPTALFQKGDSSGAAGAGSAGSASGARAHAHRFALETDARSYTLAADTEAELVTWVQQLTLAFAAANAAAAPAADAAGSRRSLKVEGDDAPRPSRSASVLIAAPTEGDLAPKLTVGVAHEGGGEARPALPRLRLTLYAAVPVCGPCAP